MSQMTSATQQLYAVRKIAGARPANLCLVLWFPATVISLTLVGTKYSSAGAVKNSTETVDTLVKVTSPIITAAVLPQIG